MKKKLTAIIAIAAMIVTMIPSMVFGAQAHTASNEAELKTALASVDNGGTVTLTGDIELTGPLTIDREAAITINGNGHSIKQSNSYVPTGIGASIMIGNSGYNDSHITTHSVIFKNVVFDGHKGDALIRSQGVELMLDECIVRNCKQTTNQSLLKFDYTEVTLKNTKVQNNDALIGIHHNFNGDSSKAKFNMDNCVIENNTFNGTAAVYYVTGGGCTINKCEFIGNDVNCNNNGATIYLGFQEDCAVTGCLFKDNDVKDSSDSKRVAGAIFFGYEANISKNAFVNNTATNANGSEGLGQSVCTSTYYDCTIDINDNYWGGGAPVEGIDYFIQHKPGSAEFKPIDNYYTEYTVDENGNVVVGNAPAEEEKPEDSPNTGDNTVAPFAVAGLILAAMAAAAVARRRYN